MLLIRLDLMDAEVFIISGRDRKTGKNFCFSGRIAREDTYA